MKQDHDSPALRLFIIADLLAQGRAINLLSCLCFAVALAGLLVGAVLGVSVVVLTGLALSLLAGLAANYLAFRTGFDARLFRWLASQPDDLMAFDRAMLTLNLMPRGKTGRPIEVRMAGARRLLVLQTLAVAMQILLAVAAAILARTFA